MLLAFADGKGVVEYLCFGGDIKLRNVAADGNGGGRKAYVCIRNGYDAWLIVGQNVAHFQSQPPALTDDAVLAPQGLCGYICHGGMSFQN